ncbi:hypothetical protein [Spirochaeta isovalerica]|uniref:Protein arginine kinase n=1 Tax=Spirochaeta isovalerica TaxID=150 RepID=A0A841R6U7_9SPIO|nr:hypothetical protein [Spirochaeta isovalerica]MBB6478927.1 protein arginine kinase [Spirochaeta isovalerica]
MSRSETDNDIVLSTRFRLARNLHGWKFISTMSEEEIERLNRVFSKEIQSNPVYRDFTVYKIDDLDELDRIVLKERKFISERFYRKGSGLVAIDEPRQTSIVTGDLDHIRISSFTEGLAVEPVMKRTFAIEEALAERYNFAMDGENGYLTANISDSGSAAKASVFLHLPVLSASDLMDHLIINTIETNLEVTGFDGGGTQSLGGLYIISTRNGSFVGGNEAGQLEKAASLFARYERDAREDLLDGRYPILEDRIFRSYGLLRYCRQISEQEALSALSLVRLGAAIDWFKDLSLDDFPEIFRSIGNGFLRSFAYESNPDENDIMRLRAETIRKGLNFNL